MFEFIFFIVIIVIAVKSQRKKLNNQQKTIEDYWKEKKSGGITRAGSNNSSYYSKQKVEQYRQQERNHIGHEDTVDLASDIGYKKCPNCQNAISKKSKTCFMCNYDFENNNANKKDVENK